MRVVIADDSEKIRFVMRGWIKILGHDLVGEAEDGREAVAICEQHKPDLALLDMSMGEHAGDVAARRIIADKLAKYVIIATSLASVKSRLEAEGIPCLIKPIHAGTLANKIKQITE